MKVSQWHEPQYKYRYRYRYKYRQKSTFQCHLSHVDPDDRGRLVFASQLLKSCSKAGQGGLAASINLGGGSVFSVRIGFSSSIIVSISIQQHQHQQSSSATNMSINISIKLKCPRPLNEGVCYNWNQASGIMVDMHIAQEWSMVMLRCCLGKGYPLDIIQLNEPRDQDLVLSNLDLEISRVCFKVVTCAERFKSWLHLVAWDTSPIGDPGC